MKLSVNIWNQSKFQRLGIFYEFVKSTSFNESYSNVSSSILKISFFTANRFLWVIYMLWKCTCTLNGMIPNEGAQSQLNVAISYVLPNRMGNALAERSRWNGACKRLHTRQSLSVSMTTCLGEWARAHKDVTQLKYVKDARTISNVLELISLFFNFSLKMFTSPDLPGLDQDCHIASSSISRKVGQWRYR